MLIRPAVLLSLLVCLPASMLDASVVRTVAITGQQAPDTPDGTTFNFSPEPRAVVLNDAGQTAFTAYLTGNGVNSNNQTGIWSEGSGSLALVARAGSQAPDTSMDVNYNLNFFSLLLNEAGQTAFEADLNGSGVDFTNDRGIWSEGSGSLALVARTGSQAPGSPIGVNYGVFLLNAPVLNDAGQTAFTASLTGSGVDSTNDAGIWSEGSGSLALVAREGSQAPGTPMGVNYGELVFSPVVLNNAGHSAFMATLTGSGVNSTNDRGIWSESSGSLALVAREGSQAPGTAMGVNYSQLSFSPVLNDAGQTAFTAILTGSGVNSTNDRGIWSEGSGSLALVAREGSQAPGTLIGVNYNEFSSPVLNDAGQTAFTADLTGIGVNSTNNRGIWSEGTGGLALVAREGSQASGTPVGVNYGLFIFEGPVLNDAGQTAFAASLIGTGVNSTNDVGIWATDRTGALQLIAREGDLLEVAPGEFRTISTLPFQTFTHTGNSDGRPSGFNNLGQLAFKATFTNGTSGIFVSNRVAIPEPNALLLLCFGSLAVLWRSGVGRF